MLTLIVPRLLRTVTAVGVLCAAVVLFSAASPPRSSARAIAKCVAASQLLPGTRAGLIRAVNRRGLGGLKLRRAGHARPGDLNYELLAQLCPAAMVKRTWYTELHPPGMPCHACDSHEYWVLLRHGGWTNLVYFAG